MPMSMPSGIAHDFFYIRLPDHCHQPQRFTDARLNCDILLPTFVGCPIAGSSATPQALMYLNGWSGKCLVDFDPTGVPTRIRNILTPDAGDTSWAEGIGGGIGLEGEVYVTGDSWYSSASELVSMRSPFTPTQ